MEIEIRALCVAVDVDPCNYSCHQHQATIAVLAQQLLVYHLLY